MKKHLTLFTASVLAVVLLLTATGCSLSGGNLKITQEGAYSLTVSTIPTIPEDAEFGDTDDSGLVVIVEKKGNGSQYSLFDMTANAYVSGAKLDKRAGEVAQSDMSVLTHGVFYSLKTNIDDKTEVTIYTREGKQDLGEAEVDGTVIIAKDGTRTYVDVHGQLQTETDEFKKIAPYGSSQFGDYYVTDDMYVFDKNGKYLYTLDIEASLNVPEGANKSGSWTVGNFAFLQYSIRLPDDSKEYDVYDPSGNAKYDLVTYRLDLKNGKITEVDMDYIVEDSSATINDGCVALEVREIEDGYVLPNTLVQTFGTNGKVAVDLQKLVPGAKSISVQGKYLIIRDSKNAYLYEGKKELYAGDTDCGFYGDLVVKESATSVYVYDLKDNLIEKFADEDIERSGLLYNGDLWYATQTEVVVLHGDTKKVETVLTLDQYTTVTDYSSYYLLTTFDATESKPGSTQRNTLYFMDDAHTEVVVAEEPTVVALSYANGASYRIVRVSAGTSSSSSVVAYYLVKNTYPTRK